MTSASSTTCSVGGASAGTRSSPFPAHTGPHLIVCHPEVACHQGKHRRRAAVFPSRAASTSGGDVVRKCCGVAGTGALGADGDEPTAPHAGVAAPVRIEGRTSSAWLAITCGAVLTEVPL